MSHQARKRFGQNFLTDQSVIDRIIRGVNPQPTEQLIEIGPGLGALTCPLLSICKQLDVIELDRDIIPELQHNCGHAGQLNIHNYDVLKFDFSTLKTTEKKLRIIGNLPYNISTPLLFHLANYADQIEDMFFMLQKEVVDRLAAAPGDSNYSRLSVMAQFYFNISPLFLVSADSFEPRPKVESIVVRLQPHPHKPVTVDNDKALFSLVTQAFSQRRKTLRNTLKTLCDARQLEAIGIDPGMRAQQLSLQQFADICNSIHK